MMAPDKIYIHEASAPEMTDKLPYHIEYVRKDAFIKKACEKLEKCMYDNLMFQGRLHRKEVINNFVEDFKKHMEG